MGESLAQVQGHTPADSADGCLLSTPGPALLGSISEVEHLERVHPCKDNLSSSALRHPLFRSFQKSPAQFEQRLLESDDGTVDIKSVILNLNRAIRKVIQSKDWTPAFDGNGWSSRQQLVRHAILTTLECSTVPASVEI